ncbi:MAG TPA: HAMP domain-containing sensor histidine kinase, partial [Vicinamibacterales bacterium]|nr:HAMP domain-containing sensor histidine kinase [Vicinamibacterales bacterium]
PTCYLLYSSSMISGRRRSVIFFTVFGIILVALAVTLNVSWIVLNWRAGVLAILGVILFALIIAGMVLNTIFLVREIRRNEQHDSFLNAVTHELKTPVASIRLYLQTLQTRELDAEKRREFYRIMLEDSDRLLHTIEQVLRAGSARSRFRREVRSQVNLGEVASECVDLARTRFHLDDQSLAYENHTRAPLVLGNADELKAAVWNLIDNAIKYSPSQVRVTVALDEPEEGRIAVRVSDRGIGISSTELKRIFRRFYRTPALGAVRTKGSGLGLFIVRSVARNHGGRAFAESGGAGHGATLTIVLPKAPGV